MQMTLRKDWEAVDATNPKEIHKTSIPAGVHEVERIPCPMGHDYNWLVLKGTMIGASEASWKAWAPGQVNENPNSPGYGEAIDWEEYTVVIAE